MECRLVVGPDSVTDAEQETAARHEREGEPWPASLTPGGNDAAARGDRVEAGRGAVVNGLPGRVVSQLEENDGGYHRQRCARAGGQPGRAWGVPISRGPCRR